MDTYAVMDIWSLYDLSFQTFDILHFNPQVSTHSFRSVNAFGFSKKHGVFSVITIKTCQSNFSMFCFCCNASRMAECQRISKLRCFSCNRNRPWSAMLKKLAVLNIRMTDSPVCKEASGIVKCCCLNKKSCNCSVNVSLTYNRNSLFVQKSICCTWHNSDFTLQLVPALDCSCLAAIFLNEISHRNLKSSYVLKLIVFYADFHVCTAILNNLCNLSSLCFRFLHLICKLRHWDRSQLNVEFFKKLTLIAHG